MKEWQYPFGQPPEAVFLMLDEGADSDKRRNLLKWLRAVLPGLNWRSHLYLIGAPHRDMKSAATSVLAIAGDFLERHGFQTLYTHCLIALRPADIHQTAVWERLVAPAKPFQNHAYQLLSETRLHISPIIAPLDTVSIAEAVTAADFFTSRLAIPSFYLPGAVLKELSDVADTGQLRFFLDPDGLGLPFQLWVSHVFETLLDRLEEDEDSLLLPCRRHVVLDEKKRSLFSCFKQWQANEAGISFDRHDFGDPLLPEPPDESLCADCVAHSALSMSENLRANRRRSEAHRGYSRLALAFAMRRQHSLAADLAHHAYVFSDCDRDRTAALLHEGLCLQAAGDLERADQVLKLAQEYAEDKGVVAYHRGRVQFEWREYIEALERFEEALASGSMQIPLKDVWFDMARCHIELAEYDEARLYLERAVKHGQKTSPLCFYLGICDLARGDAQKAMDHFGEALRLDPTPEDLGAILFYLGTCLKEMGRFEEAIDVLQRAASVEPAEILNHNLLGFCYYKLKRHEEAVLCFRRAVEINPRSAIDWASLGSNLRDLGRIPEAIEMYEKALALDPTLGFARQNLLALTKQS